MFGIFQSKLTFFFFMKLLIISDIKIRDVLYVVERPGESRGYGFAGSSTLSVPFRILMMTWLDFYGGVLLFMRRCRGAR